MNWKEERGISVSQRCVRSGNKRIYCVNENYVISQSNVWRPGSFESLDAAKLVFELDLDDDQIQQLQDRAIEDREGRTIPIEWIRELEGKSK